jgi:23S rRNA (pseudouridine1915-N3)-methyltransferase
MKIELVAIGTKMPVWVDEGVKNYQRRLPNDFKFLITALPLIKRNSQSNQQRIEKKESETMLKQLSSNSIVIALDANGKSHNSEQMAVKLKELGQINSHIQLLVGGPEGLSQSCLDKADDIWSLSRHTLSHPLVRLFVAEIVYRSWAINNNHPYHK